MSIELNHEDRAKLERLEERRMKPTRRQKGFALLRLAEGLTSKQAAMHSGISKEEVEALAAQFAESGLVGVGLAGRPRTLVRLVRPGVGVREYHLENGATLGDLLRRSKAPMMRQVAYVDGASAEESTTLRDGAIVMIVPRHVSNAAVDEPWLATIPSFQDESTFKEYLESLKAHRQDLVADLESEQ